MPSTARPSASPSQSRAVVPDGTYTIGDDMTAGTWVAAPTSGSCYWARFDEIGATIANDLTQGSRVEVTVESTDYSFHSDNCGGWVQTSEELPPDPGSAMQDETPCSLFVRESAAERNAVVGPFLTTMRGGDTPSAKLPASWPGRRWPSASTASTVKTPRTTPLASRSRPS